MGPIDRSAEAFLLLAKTPTKCCLFNAVNNHTVPLGYVINMMNRDGMNIRFVEHREFVEALSDAEKDPQKAAILSSMLAYKNMNGGTSAVPVAVRSDYTTQILARMGFFWNPTDEKYIRQFIEALVQLGFFDETNLNR